ncbi:MAG: hypothetical protein GXY83_09860 [Rhodopirellula sp.]|nr:hypothetical protein [Rhodopirellula sp.]
MSAAESSVYFRARLSCLAVDGRRGDAVAVRDAQAALLLGLASGHDLLVAALMAATDFQPQRRFGFSCHCRAPGAIVALVHQFHQPGCCGAAGLIRQGWFGGWGGP